MIGTWINIAAVLAGGAVGLVLGARFPDRLRQTVIAALGPVSYTHLTLPTKRIV